MSTAESHRLRKDHSLRLMRRAAPDERALRTDREWSNPAAPTADAPLLAYLLSVLLFMAAAGWVVHSLAQPTVLINAGAASSESEKRAPIALSSLSLQDAEQSAADVASRENERQGLQPLAVASAGNQHEPPPTTTKVAAARPPKPKRAVRAPPHYATPPIWHDAWAFAPRGNGFRSNDRFGSWWR